LEDKTFVLDTSALLAFMQDEAGAERVERILMSARERRSAIFISFISLAEIYYVSMQESGRSAALEAVVHVKALPLTVVESSERLTLSAGNIKANHRLSLADAFIAATALQTGGTLVHKDPEFEQLGKVIRLEKLPFKTSKR
jgi:predicted nucleic acid-binding protein